MCDFPGGISTSVPTTTSNCYNEPLCNCSTNMDRLQQECPSYNKSVANCSGRADRDVVMVESASGFGSDPCCPRWSCECETCYNQTKPSCGDGYQAIDLKQPEDCCSKWECDCTSCRRILDSGATDFVDRDQTVR